jgi:ubiquinone/menaquinone biosynthesis C-methylase UbiE
MEGGEDFGSRYFRRGLRRRCRTADKWTKGYDDMNTKDPYRIISRVYDLLLTPVSGLINRDLDLLYPIQAGRSVLDVGCGTGTRLAIYQNGGCRVAGIEPSFSMLARARKKLGPLVDLRAESGAAMSFDDDFFDLVILTLVLHEITPGMRALVLEECKRVCKPNGAILLADYHTGPYPFPKGWVYRAFSLVMEVIAGREHYANYRHFLAQQGLRPLIEDQQLTIDRSYLPGDGTMAFYLLKK